MGGLSCFTFMEYEGMPFNFWNILNLEAFLGGLLRGMNGDKKHAHYKILEIHGHVDWISNTTIIECTYNRDE